MKAMLQAPRKLEGWKPSRTLHVKLPAMEIAQCARAVGDESYLRDRACQQDAFKARRKTRRHST